MKTPMNNNQKPEEKTKITKKKTKNSYVLHPYPNYTDSYMDLFVNRLT